MVYSKEKFKELWEANSAGSGITYDDIADCAKAWGISECPKIRPIDDITYRVLKAADVKDAEEYNPNPAPMKREEIGCGYCIHEEVCEMRKTRTKSTRELAKECGHFIHYKVLDELIRFYAEIKDDRVVIKKNELKFHIGEWIVENCGYVWKIKGIGNQFYLLEGVEGDESHPTIEWINKNFHLWSIADAKDGDVLCYQVPATAFFLVGIFKRVAPKDELYGGTYKNYAQYGGFGSIENYTLQVALGNNELHHCGSIAYPATKEQRDQLFQKMADAGYEWRQEEKKLIKINESKFKVKDWVILNSTVAQILDKQKYGFVGLDIDGKDFFCNYGHTDSMRLWTINDARDGDVLATSVGAFIYNGKNGGGSCPGGYCYCGINSLGRFQISSGNKWTNKEVYPATKEQRDLLFQKMKNAGYEWNAEKKELKKMEVASKEGDDERIRKAIHIYLDWLDGRENYQPKGVYTIRDMIDWVIKQDKKISADKVIEWLNHHELSRDDVVTSVIPDDSPTSVPHRVKWLSDEFIKQFKKDFGL